MSITFYNFLLKMAPLRNSMSLRENTIYMKIVTFNGCNSQTLFQKKQKFSVQKNYKNSANFNINDHNLINCSRVITLNKLTSTEIHSIFVSKIENKLFCNIYLENLFNDNDIDWAAIYMLPRLVAYNTYMRSFQYKILNNVLFLNKKLHIFGIRTSPLCSFCNL